MSGEKRLLSAIMFTDIAGYTAMMGADEKKALEFLRYNRQIHITAIQKFDGIWLKEMGDGILARFDSALNAVLCAIEIQKKINAKMEYRVRIGIHLGDVTIENEDVFGDGVNIASRLQALGDPGGIYVSDSIANAIRSRDEVELLSLGIVELKNVSYPVPVYAVKAEGIPEPTKEKIASFRKKKKRPGRVAILLMVLLIILGGSLFRWFFWDSKDGQINSLAVLPLVNLTGDAEQEYFVAGMQDNLISELSKIRSLRIISRQSTLQFKGSTLPMKEIAKKLKVDALVEGSVFKSGNQVRIQIQLVKVRPKEAHLFAETYDREITDILNMHSEITQDIADNVNVQLTSEEKAGFKNKKNPVNPEAYEAYLKGLFHWHELTRGELEIARDYFKKSLAIDSSFALGYVGLSSIDVGMAQMGYKPSGESAQRSLEYLDKAYQLDSSHADLYFMKAGLYTWGLWQWEEAEQYFKRALEMNPNYAMCRIYYAQYFCILRKYDEALLQMEMALELDPLNTLYKEIYGMNLMFSGRYRTAADQLESILEQDPDSRIAMTTLRSVYHLQEKYPQAIQMWIHTYNNDNEVVKTLEEGYQEGGYSFALEELAELLIERSKTTFVTPWQIATIFTRAGNAERAIYWLNKAYQASDFNMPFINTDPIFDYLRDEPGFQILLTKMDFVD